jgi:ABC-type transport system substrate-binding protein
MFIISRLTQPADVAVADLFAKEMQAIGLPIVSFPMQDRDFYQSMRIYSFDLFIDSQSANSAPTWLYNLFDSENNISPVPLGTNLVGYANSTFDRYVEEILTSGNQDEIRNAAIKCQGILAADLPALPVFSKHMIIAARSGLPIITTVGSMGDTLRNSAVNIVRTRDFSPPLRVGFTSNFDNLDPTTSSNPADWIVLRLLTEPLFTLDQQGKLKPDLAQQWTLSNDGTLITISMRQNAKFYNGQSITVNDLVTTLNWLNNKVQASSPLYPIVKEFTRVYVLDQKTFRIVMSKPDRLAISSFTNLFALPEGRLVNSSTNLDALKSQLLVASGPFVLREFTQTDGVYMQLNEPYFGRPAQNLEKIQAFEGEIFGTPVLGSEVNIRSSLPYLSNQPVRNASYRVCTYDQDGIARQCVAGKYEWPGSYSAALHLDYRFHIGTYRVEGVVYGTLPNGAFVIFEEKTMTLQTLPLLPIAIVAILMLVIGVMVARGKLARPLRPKLKIQRRGSRRKLTGKRSLLRRRT